MFVVVQPRLAGITTKYREIDRQRRTAASDGGRTMELAELKLAAKSMSLAKSMEVVEIKYFKVKSKRLEKEKLKLKLITRLGDSREETTKI